MSRLTLSVGEPIRRPHITRPDLTFMNRHARYFSVPPFGGGGQSLLTLCLVALLTGCTMAPDYQRPEAPVSKQWPTQSSTNGAQAGKAAVDIGWQEMFADPKLRQVIQLALSHNRDLRIAALNIEKAQAQYRIQRADLLPSVNVNGSSSAQRTPASVSYTGVGGVTRSYNLDVGISSYELDLFGRIRSLKEEALQSYLSADATRRATHISLISEVAGSYLALAADQDLQHLAHETLRSRQKAYDLQRNLHAVGKSSQLELRQSEGELENARDQALSADKQVEIDRNALELLAGTPLPEALLPSPGAVGGLLGVNDLPPGLPSDLLRNRPDIQAAEHDLLGANADIGAARAAFFPTISLTASLGRASNELSGLFDSGGRSWNFSPQITLPLFSGGRLLAQLESSKVEREIAVAEYEKSIQTAFKEVADALADHHVVGEQLAAQRRRTDAAQAAYTLVRLQYENDTASYLEVLDAQRTLYAAQQSLIQAGQAQQSGMITLYKVLGGGWSQ
ncbi:efflux transporter outer membrane subunit [Pectobacterium sp. B2J-2]|uniref:efflux transporter outer membrane subunit n=1 Tax=Pectobacterium sp. B2J-2 TaxID=3385372 RepID=UPI0038FD2A29